MPTDATNVINAAISQGAYVRGKGMWKNLRKRFHHRKTFAASVAAGTVFTFFDAAPAAQICNWPTPNTLPQDMHFLLDTVRIRVVAGIDVNGAAVNTGELNTTGDETIGIHEQLRLIHENGHVKLTNDGTDVVDDFGLFNFPWGAGVDGFAALDGRRSDGTPNAQTISAFNNGSAAMNNAYRLVPGWLIQSQTQLQFQITFPGAQALTGGGVIEVMFEGNLQTPPV